jgi:aspartyl-tRNA(Asn)/glutamyl-tRNA(Gln) amidotransferase subunit A
LEVTQRIAELNAFITILDASAREALPGPLHGIPFAAKDMFWTRGVRTTCGSKIFEHFVPDEDAAAVERLTAAGAVLVGKTNMHELAYGITSTNPHFGAVRNPRDPERIPGGSSGGSGAAVAAGMVPIALGSDTGGSIRIPASYCGVVGLKPTFGRVSRYGAMPLGPSFDHVGPLAHTVRDAALALNALAGFDPRDETSSQAPVEDYVPPPEVSIAGVRVGLPENFFFDRVEEEVAQAVRRAASIAETLGARVVPVHLPDIEAMNGAAKLILLAEAAAEFRPYLDRRGEFGADVLALLDQGRAVTAVEYLEAQRQRHHLRTEFAAVWEQADCLFTPTTPLTAPKIGETTVTIGGEAEDVRMASTRLVRPFNLLGLPAVSLPCGLDTRSLPIGLQIVAPAFEEARLLRIAAALEAALSSPAGGTAL